MKKGSRCPTESTNLVKVLNRSDFIIDCRYGDEENTVCQLRSEGLKVKEALVVNR